MKFLLQKASAIKIYKNDEALIDIPAGLCFLIYVGIEKGDEIKDLTLIVDNLLNLQLIDENNKFKKSIKDMRPHLIFISNITLIAAFKNLRINFNQSLDKKLAQDIFDNLISLVEQHNLPISKIDFGSQLKIQALNLGPVNFFISF